MAETGTDNNLAVFCDFENIAIGVRDAKYAKFNMQLVLDRLRLKDSIVVKKAYCDRDRYKRFNPTMHESAFELIELPHTRQSGKNSADIRMVVDALDLCYTKSHIDNFVIITGDSDFLPLVSKLRENAKIVFGIGVKNSTSDLLVHSCDEFIFYDDLVRISDLTRPRNKRPAQKTTDADKTCVATGRRVSGQRKKENPREERNGRDEAVDLFVETAEALFSDQADRLLGLNDQADAEATPPRVF